MATLAEKIAAKKALAAGLAPMVDVTVQHVVDAVIEEKKEEQVCQKTSEPIIVEAEKSMTFAEKMALKKAQAASLVASKPAIQPEQSTVQPISPQLTNSSVVTAPIAKKLELPSVQSQQPSSEISEAEAKTAQAYADIKAKITLLSDMAEADLPNAMKELKAALLQNPQACYLMMPQDIGQMVIALRTMRQEAAVEATEAKEKGPKKAKASKNLTAEEIAAAFDSL